MTTYKKLKSLLQEMEGVVIGYSGGVDSTLLAKAATDALGDRAVCVLLETCLVPAVEREEAIETAVVLGLNLVRLQVDVLNVPGVPENDPDRCYYCKQALFSKMLDIAKKHGIEYVLDGSNVDDQEDYRPGTKALEELGIRSPFRELEMTKEQVRAMSRDVGLPTWNKPSFACLASRVPYGTPLTPEILNRIERSEQVMRNLGFKQFRVRHHGDIARIELMPLEMEKMITLAMRICAVRELKALGYAYVTLDLTGYRSGSLNETLELEK